MAKVPSLTPLRVMPRSAQGEIVAVNTMLIAQRSFPCCQYMAAFTDMGCQCGTESIAHKGCVGQDDQIVSL